MTNRKLNPFRYGKPVPPEHFIGRKEAIRTIFSRIHNCESTAIVGDPHIGKTSFLRYIRNEQVRSEWLDDSRTYTYTFIDIDCHLLPGGYQPSHFWCEVLDQIEEYFPEDTILKQIAIVRQSTYGSFTLKRLFDLLGRNKMRVVVLIDEFEVLLHHTNFNTAEFFGALRSLSALTDGLLIVTASRLSVAEMNRRSQEINPLGSPFFNTFTEVRLLPLHPAEVDQLLDQALEGTDVILTQGDRDYIKRMSGRHPYLAQMAAAALFEAIARGKRESERFDEASGTLRGLTVAHFDDLWRSLGQSVRKMLVVLALAEIEQPDDQIAQAEVRREEFDRYDTEMRWLSDGGIVEQANGAESPGEIENLVVWRGSHWRISAKSFAEWIVSYAPASSPEDLDVLGPVNRIKLRQLLSEHFDEDELRMLCFDLEVDFESLPGEGKASKARELVTYFERHGRLAELLAVCRQRRPNTSW